MLNFTTARGGSEFLFTNVYYLVSLEDRTKSWVNRINWDLFGIKTMLYQLRCLTLRRPGLQTRRVRVRGRVRLGLGLGSIQDNILPNYFLIW